MRYVSCACGRVRVETTGVMYLVPVDKCCVWRRQALRIEKPAALST